jgi:hypothetical protein
MKRQAYGFRDHEFFKLKILGIHETKYALLGRTLIRRLGPNRLGLTRSLGSLRAVERVRRWCNVGYCRLFPVAGGKRALRLRAYRPQ